MLWIITNVNPRVFADDEQSHGHLFGDGKRGERLSEKMRGLAREAIKPFIQGWAQTADEFTHEFRLLDDDGVIYLEGVCADITDVEADKAFAPQDWAAGLWGCTMTEYRLKGSKLDWEVL